MEKFQVIVGHGKDSQVYDVFDMGIQKDGSCKFEVFNNNEFILSLDKEGPFLKTCTNPGEVDEESIYLISAKIKENRN